MKKYAPKSDKKVQWNCSRKSCHKWITAIKNRKEGQSCPMCSNNTICKTDQCNSLHNNCSVLVREEWNEEKNGPMKNYFPGSQKSVYWVCSENSEHEWKCILNDRTGSHQSGCPRCNDSKSYSEMANRWIRSIMVRDNISIQYAESEEGEYKVGKYRVDGFCEETNKIYEFYEDFWHGNLKLFKREDINPVSKKTYGELYDNTMKRKEYIIGKGYEYEDVWESDFLEST